jgi:hypothetical protein
VCIPLWILELINGSLTITIAVLAQQSGNVRIFQARYGPLVSTALILSVIVRRAVFHLFQYAISPQARLGRHFEYRNSVLVHAQKQPRPRGVRSRRPRLKGRLTYSVFFFDSRMRTVSKKVIMYALGQSSIVIDGRMIDSHDTETGILTWYMHIHICA